MKILHIINDGINKKVQNIINSHKLDNDVKVIFLNNPDISYMDIVDDIEKSDKVFSWNNESQ